MLARIVVISNVPSIRITVSKEEYQVGIEFQVTPVEIIWEASDLENKQVNINTGESQQWNIIPVSYTHLRGANKHPG